jgi:hypothetical protein
LGGTYVWVEALHLFRYVDEQAFRYNHRKDADDRERFIAAMKQIVGRRLTYKELIGGRRDKRKLSKREAQRQGRGPKSKARTKHQALLGFIGTAI